MSNQNLVNLTIDGESVAVPQGTTILEAARRLNVHIPTLCYHEDQAVKAVCRICVVEVEGQRLLPAACSTPVSEGMVVKTASPKVIAARKNIMELILARHPQDCLNCSKNGRCELQKIARDLNMTRPNRTSAPRGSTTVRRPLCGICASASSATAVLRHAVRSRASW